MPPPLWHPHYAIVMNYRYEKSQNFRVNLKRCYPDAPRPPPGDWWRKRGASYKKKRFSYENRSLPDLMIGSGNLPTPFCDGCRRPEGRPAAASITGFLGDRTCPARGPDAGKPHKNVINFLQFSWSGCELPFICVSTEQKF